MPETENKTRILLVDDEKNITDSLTVNLEATGRFVVKATNDPLKTVETALAFEPDVILLDVVMPKMDGGDVQRAVRAESRLKQIPIILVTALLSNEEVGDGSREAGGDYMLAKPVRLPVLVKLIDRLVTEGAS
ncbi:MAG: response regulator [Opitutales bacterium]